LLFYEYFHGDNGAGLGASHQTGWTGVIARILHLFATMSADKVLQGGKATFFELEVDPGLRAGSSQSGRAESARSVETARPR
jgi:hypothetical protein